MRLRQLRTAHRQPTGGAARADTGRCLELARAMAADDVTVAAFPEQVIGGYAAEDLVQWIAFVASQRTELERFALETRELATVFCLGVTIGVGGDLFNCAAVVHRGEILGLVPKEKLPTYNIFYEARTFS